MQTLFVAENELERKLESAMKGKLGVDALLVELMKHQIYLPLAQDPGPNPDSRSIQPAILTSKQGSSLVAVFTSKKCADGFLQQAKAFKYILLVEAKWLVNSISPNLGIVFNPGWPVGFEWNASGIADFRKTLPKPN
jgi:hypothetical protein